MNRLDNLITQQNNLITSKIKINEDEVNAKSEILKNLINGIKDNSLPSMLVRLQNVEAFETRLSNMEEINLKNDFPASFKTLLDSNLGN